MLKMALRNIFRNKKRSFLTTLIVIIGIAGMTVGQGWLIGAESMFTEEGKRITGDIRITAKDFEIKEKSLDVSSNIEYITLSKKINNFSDGISGVARIKFGAAMFYGDEDEKGLGFGIEEGDYSIVGFDHFMYEGRFLDFNSQNEILLGEKLKRKLNLKLGNEVTLLTATQNGSISAFNYTVVGFYKMDNSRLNRSFYITLSDAQYLLDLGENCTEYLIFLDKPDLSDKTLQFLKDNYGNAFLIKSWDEIGINKYISAVIPIVRNIFVSILAILCAVGISNTMIMVVFERRKEIGILKSLGMETPEIRTLFCIEGGLIGLIGSFFGMLIGGGIVYYYSIIGVNLGSALENISDEINVKSIIYMSFSLKILLRSFTVGFTAAILSTLLSVNPELKKSAVENLRNE
jgi:putative ABC transport system permease protein